MHNQVPDDYQDFVIEGFLTCYRLIFDLLSIHMSESFMKLLTLYDIFQIRNHLVDYHFYQWNLFDRRTVRHFCHKRDFLLWNFSILHTLGTLLDNSACRWYILLAIYWLCQQKCMAVREDTLSSLISRKRSSFGHLVLKFHPVRSNLFLKYYLLSRFSKFQTFLSQFHPHRLSDRDV